MCGCEPLNVDDDVLAASSDPDDFIGRMDSPGGVAPAQLAKLVGNWRSNLERDIQRFDMLTQQFDDADAELVVRAEAIVGLSEAEGDVRRQAN